MRQGENSENLVRPHETNRNVAKVMGRIAPAPNRPHIAIDAFQFFRAHAPQAFARLGRYIVRKLKLFFAQNRIIRPIGVDHDQLVVGSKSVRQEMLAKALSAAKRAIYLNRLLGQPCG